MGLPDAVILVYTCTCPSYSFPPVAGHLHNHLCTKNCVGCAENLPFLEVKGLDVAWRDAENTADTTAAQQEIEKPGLEARAQQANSANQQTALHATTNPVTAVGFASSLF